MNCWKCGANNADDCMFCEECGADLRKPPVRPHRIRHRQLELLRLYRLRPIRHSLSAHRRDSRQPVPGRR